MERNATERKDVNFLLIHIENKAAQAKQFCDRHNITNAQRLQCGEVPAEYGIRYIPHHVVIGKDGKILLNYDKPTRDYMSVV